MLRSVDDQIQACRQRWGREAFPFTVEVSFSARMTRSLGRCDPTAGRVVLAERLRDADPELAGEVVCHELAHLAARRLHGPGVRFHGTEWATLMEQAGFVPRRLPVDPSTQPTPRRPQSYVHRCAVCQWTRRATKRVRSWRCPVCRDHGLEGQLVIEQDESAC